VIAKFVSIKDVGGKSGGRGSKAVELIAVFGKPFWHKKEMWRSNARMEQNLGDWGKGDTRYT
jgi:hypothetical protein